jgi:hypothetical protein
VTVPAAGRLRASVGGWPGLAVAWLTVLAATGSWLAYTPPETLRQQLVVAQFWSLEAGALLAAICVVAIARDVARRLERRDLAVLAAVAGLALLLTLGVAPRTHRIFYDEQIYQGIGQNLSDLKLAQMCNDGHVEYGRLQCLRGEYNKQPYAYPHLLSIGYRVVGVRASVPFAINAAAVVATAWGVYAWILLVFRDRTAAGLGALIAATVPQQILWSATAAVEPTASLACVLAVVAAAHAAQGTHRYALAAVGVLLAYAVQFRPESLLIVGPIAVLAWNRHPEGTDRRHLAWVLLLVLALLAVHVAHLFAVRNEGWGTSGPRLAWAYVWPNLKVNGPFYLGDGRFPVLYTGLALAGLASRAAWRARLTPLIYFGVFFGIGLLFYAGSYDYGADVRYSVLTSPPLAVLGGVGAARLGRWASRRMPEGQATALVVVAMLVQTSWYVPVMRATTEEAWAARADVRYAREFARQLPAHAYVLTQNPSMFHVWGINAGQMSLVTTNPLYLTYLRLRHPGAVYVHWNYWCNAPDQVQQEYCRRALAAAPVEMVGSYQERDQRFAFYRMAPHETPAGPARPSTATAGQRDDVAKSH